MAICEDAPCCGCCGTSLYGSEDRSIYGDEMSYDDYYEDERFYDAEPDECADEDHECVDCDGPSGTWETTENGIEFVPDGKRPWCCSYCDRPCPEDAHQDGRP